MLSCSFTCLQSYIWCCYISCIYHLLQFIFWKHNIFPQMMDPTHFEDPPTFPDFCFLVKCLDNYWIEWHVHIFMVPRGWICRSPDFSSTATNRLAFVVQREIFLQLLDELPCNLELTILVFLCLGDTLTFHLTPSSGASLKSSNTSFYYYNFFTMKITSSQSCWHGCRIWLEKSSNMTYTFALSHLAALLLLYHS